MKTSQALHWIEGQKKHAVELLKTWASINSGSENSEGLEKMSHAVNLVFSPLADETKIIPLSTLGNVLLFSKRKPRILLGGHMDTVYPKDSSFKHCYEKEGKLFGPGVADMKGGLVVLFLALSAYEKFAKDPKVGWVVLINPDEEIGSPGSFKLWKQMATQVELALLFEPSFPDGSIVDKRKGSITYQLIVKGIEAHAGRDFHKGKSAIKAISQFIVESYSLAESYDDLSLNFAKLNSNFPLNVIASEASCSINVRSYHSDDLNKIEIELQNLALQLEKKSETKFNLIKLLKKSPKTVTDKTLDLINKIKSTGNQIKLDIKTCSSGGLSDGNILAECGLACIDTLGVIGGHLHTPNEYMEIESMIERAKLTFLFLMEFSKE